MSRNSEETRQPAGVAGRHHSALEDPRPALEGLLGVPFTHGNSIEVLPNGEAFRAMFREIARSQRSIDMIWFLWGTGAVTHQLAEALAARARAGVRVRILLDGFGARGIDHRVHAALRDAGCLVVFYRPIISPRLTALNLRTHRRALIFDEQTAMTGGTGIDQAWTGSGIEPGQWRDSSFLVRGPAVNGLRAAFATAWLQTAAPALNDSDTFPTIQAAGESAVQVLLPQSQPGWNQAALALEVLLQSARERFRIATPYARVPARLSERIVEARGRGVQIQLLTPGRKVVDHPLARVQEEHGYDMLLEAGVEIWHYQPAMLHSKVVTVDKRFAVLGTANFDRRSLTLNEQVTLVVDDPGTVATLDEHFDKDLSRSERLDRRHWAERGRLRALGEAAGYLVGYPLSGLGAWKLTRSRP